MNKTRMAFVLGAVASFLFTPAVLAQGYPMPRAAQHCSYVMTSQHGRIVSCAAPMNNVRQVSYPSVQQGLYIARRLLMGGRQQGMGGARPQAVQNYFNSEHDEQRQHVEMRRHGGDNSAAQMRPHHNLPQGWGIE